MPFRRVYMAIRHESIRLVSEECGFSLHLNASADEDGDNGALRLCPSVTRNEALRKPVVLGPVLKT